MNKGKRIALALVILVFFIAAFEPVFAQTQTFSLVNGKQLSCTWGGGFLRPAACKVNPDAGIVERGLSFLLRYVGWGGLNFLLAFVVVTFLASAALSKSHAFENDGVRTMVSLIFGFSAGVAVLTSGFNLIGLFGFAGVILIPIAVALGLRYIIVYLFATLSPVKGGGGKSTSANILNVLLWVSLTLIALWFAPILLKIP